MIKPPHGLLADTNIGYNHKSSDRFCFISASQFNCNKKYHIILYVAMKIILENSVLMLTILTHVGIPQVAAFYQNSDSESDSMDQVLNLLVSLWLSSDNLPPQS